MATDAAGGGAPSGVEGVHEGGDERSPALAALARLRRWGGDDLVRDMVGIFLTDMPQRLAAARAALSAGDGHGVALPAHAMKSSSAQLGASALAALCAVVESRAGRGELADLAPVLDAAELELSRFSAWLGGQAGVVVERGAAP